MMEGGLLSLLISGEPREVRDKMRCDAIHDALIKQSGSLKAQRNTYLDLYTDFRYQKLKQYQKGAD